MLDLNVALPDSLGVTVATIVAFSPTVKSNEVGSTLKLVLMITGAASLTVTLTALKTQSSKLTPASLNAEVVGRKTIL